MSSATRPLIICMIALLSTAGIAGDLSFRWSTEVSNPAPYDCEAMQGETFALCARLVQYGAPLIGAATATYYYQTKTMTSTEWYTVPAAWDASTATATVLWSPEIDIGSNAYRWFFGVTSAQGKNYRAYGTLRLKTSPGFSPATLTPKDVKQELIDAITADIKTWSDTRYMTSYTETDPTVSTWAKTAQKPAYAWSEITSRPTTWAWRSVSGIPSWIGSNKPTYTASEVGAYTTAKTDELINTSSSLARFLMASTPGATTQNWQYDVRPSALGGVHPVSSTISVKGSTSGTVSTAVETDGVSPVASLTAVQEGAQIVAYSGWNTSPTLAHAGVIKAKANAQDNSEVSSVELRADRDGTVRARLYSRTNPYRIKDPSAFDDSDLISKGAANSLARDAASIEVMRHATNRNNPHGVTAAQLGALTAESDPTVSAWAKAQNKPAYTAAEVGAAEVSSVSMVTNGVTYVWTWSESEGTFALVQKK